MAEARVFIPADEVQVEFVPGSSTVSLPVPAKRQSKDTVGYQMTPFPPI